MNLRCMVSLLLAGIILQGYAQDKKSVTSKLNEVTVFPQGAELTHTASAALLKGENELWIEGLSPIIDNNSVKIKVSNGVIVSAYEFSVDYLTELKNTPNPAISKLQDSIEYFKKKITLAETDAKVNTELINILKKSTDKNVAGSEKGVSIEELIKTMDYYKNKQTELENIQRQNDKNRKEWNSAVQRLQNQLSQESTKNDKASGVLKINLSSPLTTSVSLTISYYTAAASWTPYHDINVLSIDHPITIVGKAKVRQTTGLDWVKVKLTLSTATPSNGKVAPLFDAWFLNFYQPQPKPTAAVAQNSYSYDKGEVQELEETVVTAYDQKTDRISIRGTASGTNNPAPIYIVDGQEVDEDYLASLDPTKIKNLQVLKDAASTSAFGSRGANGVIVISLKNSMDDYITQKENDLNMVYSIDQSYTIPGNGKEQSIDLQTKETPAEYKYYCAPKLDPETFLLAEISNWEQLNLLSGKANITYDGTYIGETYINARSTQEKLTLTLGADKRVSVKREKLQDFSSTKFLGNDTKQVFTYRLTAKNNQNKTVKMVLKDQYPISTQKNIEVELLTKDTTPWTVKKDDLGVITWEEELKAGETKLYQLSYSVKYPKGSNLNL